MESKVNKSKTEAFNSHDLLLALPEHIYWLNAKSVFLGCNVQQAQDLGLFSTEEIIGKTPYNFYSQKEADQIVNNNRVVLTSGVMRVFEETITNFDKEKKIFRSFKAPIGNNGKINGLIGISIDITREKELEKKLKKLRSKDKKLITSLNKEITGIDFKITPGTSLNEIVKHIRDYYENLIALMPGHVYWIDRNGLYLGCNNNQAISAGLESRKDIVGKKNKDLPWNYNSKTLPESLDNTNLEIMKTGLPLSIEEPATLGNGSKAVFLSNKVPIRDKKNDIIGLLGISIDITKQKQLEMALRDSKEKAEAANMAKDQFIENMQHDLRTPTAGIYGMMKIYAEQEKDPQKKKMFEAMSSSAKSLLKLLDSVLHYLHIESHDLPIFEKKFHVQRVIEDVVNLERPAAITSGLKLKVEINKNVPKILKGDESRLHQILIDLLSNAIKFTQRGSVSLRVKRKLDKNTQKKQVFIKFIIEDTGIGISKRQQEDLYTKFVKFEPSNTCGTYRGAGLGLAVIKQFVDDLGGEIDLISKVGQGSKFTVLLPFMLPLANEPDEEDFENKIFFD